VIDAPASVQSELHAAFWVDGGLIVLLAATLYSSYFTDAHRSPWRRYLAPTSAAALVGALAFAGHAAAGSGVESVVHQIADVLHLLAAASWVGALLPLAVLLGAAGNNHGESSVAIAREATLRFSALGIVSVGTVLTTGIVNSWELAGSVRAL
jgi:putative copper resistance protein D